MPRITALVLSAATVALSLAACGGSSTKSSAAGASSPPAATSPAGSGSTAASPTTAGTGTVAIAADPSGQLRFDKTSLTAKAGKVTIQFTNKSPLSHNLTVAKGTSGAVIGATPTFSGGTRTLTVTLAPGTYTYFCSVPGHRQAGMQGTLTVQ